MALNDDGSYVFSDFQEKAYVDLVASMGNTQRAQLRQLAEPGEPLWLVQEEMVRYGNAIRDALAACDLNSVEGLAIARKLQGELNAVKWQRALWERILSQKPEQEEEIEQ